MRKFLLFFGVFFTTVLLGAQELKLEHTNAPDKVPFAQPFTLQYHFSYPAGYQPVWDQAHTSKEFEVRLVQSAQQAPNAAGFDFSVIPFTLGKSTFTISFQLKQGDTLSEPQSFSLPLEVTPVKTFNDKKIREIRPPFKIRGWFWLLVLLALAALICAIYYWKNRRKTTQHLQVTAVQDTRPSHVIALSKIEALLQSGLWENEQYKVFYITLVDILREYLQRRFNLDVSAETSSELIAHIKTKEELQSFVSALRTLLNESDLIKFAKAVPEEAQRNRHIVLLRDLVQQTTPRETPQNEVKK